MLDEAARCLADAHRALVADRVLEPLASDAHDTRRWMDCDLASFVENRLFETMDPTMLTDDLRQAWTSRAVRPDERIESPHERAWYLSAFWLLAAGERVGTIALANSLAGSDVVSVWSLYVMPRYRGRGIAGRALRACDAVLGAHGARGLGWHEKPAGRSPGCPRPREAPGTLATALAVRGWPLIRSEEAWARRHNWSDSGEPEGLAYKIEIFEAIDRRHGFTVRTPRIPGLRYRDLDAID